MLKIQIKNYDEFREIFGTRCSSRGCIQNKVLLAFWKYRFKLDGDGRATQIRSMQQLYDLVVTGLSQHHLENGGIVFRAKGSKISHSFESKRYLTPTGGCVDYAKPGNIKYIDTTHCDRYGNGKLCSMGAGRFLRKIIEEHQPRIPESVITYCTEEFQRTWEADITKMVSGYELVVDKHFDWIYDAFHLQDAGSFGSCMTNKNQWSFYRDFVDASAAYLTKDGKIYARCIVYHNVATSDGKLHNYAERQYAQNQSELLKTLLVNKLVDGGYVDLYKVIGAGCRETTNIINAKTGKKLEDPRVSTKCVVTTGGRCSFMDTFRFYYPSKAIMSNYEMPEFGTRYDLDHTTSVYNGPNPTIPNQD